MSLSSSQPREAEIEDSKHSGIDDRSSLSVSMPQELDFSFPVALYTLKLMDESTFDWSFIRPLLHGSTTLCSMVDHSSIGSTIRELGKTLPSDSMAFSILWLFVKDEKDK